MIHLSMSACRPPDLSLSEFDAYFRERHMRFAKLLEGLRLLSVVRVQLFHGPGTGVEPDWFVDVWWEDSDAVTRCFRSPGGLALLGDRMTMMLDPLPAVADVTEQMRHGTTWESRFDPSVGPRVVGGNTKLHVMVPEQREGNVDRVVDTLAERWTGVESPFGVEAFSVGRGTGTAYPLNNVITGVEPPTLPRAASRRRALELWLSPGTDLDTVASRMPALGALLEDPRSVWWYGETREVMMSLPVASFMALDPVEAGR